MRARHHSATLLERTTIGPFTKSARPAGLRTAATAFRRGAAVLLLLGLAGCGQAEAPDDAADPALGFGPPQIVSGEEAVSGANVPSLDPHTMNGAEISAVIGDDSHCSFRYTADGGPVLAFRPAAGASAGVVKLAGDLVPLDVSPEGDTVSFRAGPVGLALAADTPDAAEAPGSRSEATLVFAIADELRVGYRGFADCAP